MSINERTRKTGFQAVPAGGHLACRTRADRLEARRPRQARCPSSAITCIVMAVCLAFSTAHAVILFDINPINAREPTAPGYANSGWEHEGIWGGYLGTPIAPSFFISAGHVGQAAGALRFQGVDYPVIRGYGLRLGFDKKNNPLYSDLVIWQIADQFPFVAPLYTAADEAGKRLIVIGRGTERGGEVSRGDTVRGWHWGAGFGQQRWGENIVTKIAELDLPGNDAIYAQFDQNGLPFEAHLSNGDSGGAVFIEENGVWKLAGINYAVDGPFFPEAAMLDGSYSLFNAHGFFYDKDGQLVQITAPDPAPSGFYASRISSRLDWIYGVIDPAGDADNDGVRNLAEHGLKLHPLAPDAAGQPQVARDGEFLTLTYRKNLAQGDLTFVVKQSQDLVNWERAETQDEVTPVNSELQIIKAKVAIGSAPGLFLRLEITRP